jgi:hypothetical protein
MPLTALTRRTEARFQRDKPKGQAKFCSEKCQKALFHRTILHFATETSLNPSRRSSESNSAFGPESRQNSPDEKAKHPTLRLIPGMSREAKTGDCQPQNPDGYFALHTHPAISFRLSDITPMT